MNHSSPESVFGPLTDAAAPVFLPFLYRPCGEARGGYEGLKKRKMDREEIHELGHQSLESYEESDKRPALFQ